MAAIKNDKMGFNMNTNSAPSPEILETANAFVDEVIKEAEEIARKKKATLKNDKMEYNTSCAHLMELIETGNAFVNEVIKEAEEIARKKKGLAEGNGQDEMSGLAAIIKRGTRWQNRARGIVTRIVGMWNGTFGSKRRNKSKGDK